MIFWYLQWGCLPALCLGLVKPHSVSCNSVFSQNQDSSRSALSHAFLPILVILGKSFSWAMHFGIWDNMKGVRVYSKPLHSLKYIGGHLESPGGCHNLLPFPKYLTPGPLYHCTGNHKNQYFSHLILISLLGTESVGFSFNVKKKKKKNHDYLLHFRHFVVSKVFTSLGFKNDPER